jgi:hypothetical protein
MVSFRLFLLFFSYFSFALGCVFLLLAVLCVIVVVSGVCVSCSVIIVMSGKPVYYVRVMCKYNYLLTNISSSTVVVGSNPALGSGGVGGDEKLLDLF